MITRVRKYCIYLAPSKSDESQQLAPFSSPFATSVLQRSVANRAGGSGSLEPLLPVREVAKRLLVCTATVYRLCASGRLWHIRVSNAVRVPEVALKAFMESSGPLKSPKAWAP